MPPFFWGGGPKGESEDLKDWEVSSLRVNDVKFPPPQINKNIFLKRQFIHLGQCCLCEGEREFHPRPDIKIQTSYATDVVMLLWLAYKACINAIIFLKEIS